jgi:hypothetical protein
MTHMKVLLLTFALISTRVHGSWEETVNKLKNIGLALQVVEREKQATEQEKNSLQQQRACLEDDLTPEALNRAQATLGEAQRRLTQAKAAYADTKECR